MESCIGCISSYQNGKYCRELIPVQYRSDCPCQNCLVKTMCDTADCKEINNFAGDNKEWGADFLNSKEIK